MYKTKYVVNFIDVKYMILILFAYVIIIDSSWRSIKIYNIIFKTVRFL